MPKINTALREYKTANISLIETTTVTDGGAPVIKVNFSVTPVQVTDLVVLRNQLTALLAVIEEMIAS